VVTIRLGISPHQESRVRSTEHRGGKESEQDPGGPELGPKFAGVAPALALKREAKYRRSPSLSLSLKPPEVRSSNSLNLAKYPHGFLR